MKEKDPTTGPKSSGNQPPPHPPKSTAIAANPDDEGDSRGKNPRKETVRINLPPKPGAAPTIKLPTLPPGQPAIAGIKLTKGESLPAFPSVPGRQPRSRAGNVELTMILTAVLLLNGMLYVLCRL